MHEVKVNQFINNDDVLNNFNFCIAFSYHDDTSHITLYIKAFIILALVATLIELLKNIIEDKKLKQYLLILSNNFKYLELLVIGYQKLTTSLWMDPSKLPSFTDIYNVTYEIKLDSILGAILCVLFMLKMLSKFY